MKKRIWYDWGMVEVRLILRNDEGAVTTPTPTKAIDIGRMAEDKSYQRMFMVEGDTGECQG